MWNKLLTVGLVFAILTSCGTKRHSTKAPAHAGVDNNMKAKEDYLINNLDFHTFSGRAKAKVEFGNDKQDVTLHIRIQRNKAIWISVTATFLNYEAARVLITPDSVKILNKLQSEYITKPFSYIHKYTGAGINFNTLQDLLIANVSQDLIRTDQLTIASADDDVQLVGVKDDLAFQYSLNGKYRPKVFRLSPIGSDESLESYYSSFNDVTGYNFPQKQNIKLNASSIQVNAILDYNKVEFNQELEMPFTAPARYKIVN